MTSKTKIMDVLLRAENDSYLQEYVKPYTSDYVIMADNSQNVLLGTDDRIGQYYSDNRDGLKEAFVLLDFIHINESHRQGSKKLILYPDKQTALNVLDDDFKEKVNAHLANSMGNLLNRSLSMLVKYFDGEIREEFLTGRSKEAESLLKTTLGTVKIVENHFNHFEIQEAAQEIISIVDATNKFVTDNAPWTLAKEEKMTECGQVLATVLEVMCVVSSLIYPYCPNIAADMANQLAYDITTKLDDITTNNIKVGKLIEKEDIHPVFLRVDSELSDKAKVAK